MAKVLEIRLWAELDEEKMRKRKVHDHQLVMTATSELNDFCEDLLNLLPLKYAYFEPIHKDGYLTEQDDE